MKKPKIIRPRKDTDIDYIAKDLQNNAALISALKLDPRNPRQGEVEVVAKSLQEHRQQKTITIYQFPGEDFYTVITGNHTTKAAISIGWKYIAVSEYHGPPEKAKAFAVVDNRSSDLATYDDDVLAEILTEMKENNLLETVGYTDTELDYLLSKVSLEEEDDDPEITGESHEIQEYLDDWDLDEKNEGGLVTYNKDMVFKSTNKWGLPNLLKNMLADPPDKTIKTWPTARFAETDWPGYWWLVWGNSSKKIDYTKTYLCFYAPDESLERLYNNPNRYLKNFTGVGLKAIVSPDFSMHGYDPYAIRLFNNYKDRWLGRYFQEVGIKVIPNVCNSPYKGDLEYIYRTIPKNPPCVALQVQTGLKRDKSSQKVYYKTAIEQMVTALHPQSVIVYASSLGHELTTNSFPKSIHTIRVATAQDAKRPHYKSDPLVAVKKKKTKKRIRRKRSSIEL